MLKDDFAVGRPISQVPAAWFNAVAKFVNGLTAGGGIRINRDGGALMRTEVSLDPDGARTIVGAPSAAAGTPDDRSDAPTVLDENGDTWSWTPGGDNGLTLDCYCKIAPQVVGSVYSVFQRCRLTFSKGGLLAKAELLAGRVRIQAKNA